MTTRSTFKDRPSAGETGPGRPDSRSRATRWLLALALATGALRFLALGTWSLWLDEAFTLADAPHAGSFANPLGYALFDAWFRLLSGRPDEFLLRLPSALLGWACIPLTAWALAPLAGRRAAALAALIVALSPWHVFWSQSARFYTLAQALGLLGGGLFVRGLTRGRGLPLVLGLGAVSLAVLAHPSAALLAGALLVTPWFVRLATPRSERPPMTWAWRALLVLLVLAPLTQGPRLLATWDLWSAVKGAATPLHFVRSSGFLVGPGVGLALVLAGLEILRRRRFTEGLALAVPLAGGLAGLGAATLVRASAQYVFVLLPWLAGLAALGVLPCGRAPRRWLGVLVLLPLAVDLGLYFGARGGDRPPWRAAYRFVEAHAEPGDLVLGMDAPVGEYYLDPRKRDLRNWGRVTWLDAFRADVALDWDRYPRRTWLIVNRELLRDWPAEKRARMQAYLAECRVAWERVVRFTPRDLSLRVYLRE